jgi:hypothetical protein
MAAPKFALADLTICQDEEEEDEEEMPILRSTLGSGFAGLILESKPTKTSAVPEIPAAPVVASAVETNNKELADAFLENDEDDELTMNQLTPAPMAGDLFGQLLAKIPKQEEQEPIIYYTDFCVIKRESDAKCMTHEEMNQYDFQNSALYEVIRDQRFVRPFFDFDTVDTRPKIEKLLDVLDKLTQKWGPYASLGYTNNHDCQDGCPNVTFKPDAKKTSFHIYFYEAKMSREEAHKLHSEVHGLNTEDFEYDASVYKASGKQQVFRALCRSKWNTTSRPKKYIFIN